MKQNLKLITIALVALASKAVAQESTNPIDTIATYVQKMNTSVTTLQKFKVSGYIQSQWQKADSMGIKSYSGGDFDSKMDNRFAVRRGRIKFSYTGTLSNYVLQLEATEKGVSIKDAYGNFTEPWLQAFTVTGGVFNRPFGFEVPFSSSSLESPERARFNQTLFPGEEDLGASITFQMPKTSLWNFLKFEAGYFAGNGINPEFDKKKDFIGHIGIQKATSNEKIRFGFGLSYYNGGVYQGTKNVYKMKKIGGVEVFSKVSADSTVGDFNKRQYFGTDAQLTFETALGLTTLRGEYIFGTQPGNDKSTTSPTSDFTKVTATVKNGAVTVSTVPDSYLRNFNAGYICFIQSIAHTPLTFVAKYDFYDPNTKVNGNEIGQNTTGTGIKATNDTDLKYTTLGLGLIYAVSSNVKITAYYDMVANEKSKNLKPDFSKSNSNFAKDLKDNVFTLRLQYKF